MLVLWREFRISVRRFPLPEAVLQGSGHRADCFDFLASHNGEIGHVENLKLNVTPWGHFFEVYSLDFATQNRSDGNPATTARSKARASYRWMASLRETIHL